MQKENRQTKPGRSKTAPAATTSATTIHDEAHQSRRLPVESSHEVDNFTNRQDSPSLIVDLDRIESPLVVKPPANQCEDATGPSKPIDYSNVSDNCATNDSSDDSTPSLPLTSTVTRLNTPNGAEVFLIGTAHFSHQSVKDVQTVIRSIKPSFVVMELCRERAFMLDFDEQSLLEQNRTFSFDKIRNAMAERGFAQGLIYVLLVKMSATLVEKLGMAPGVEFRAASVEAKKIPGCFVILADRPINVTIARAVASVSLWQKLKLIYHVVTQDVALTHEDVEKCKDADMLQQLLTELGVEFPGFKKVLLDERDIFLAHTIYRWAEISETSHGPPRLVAVVGIGHVAGIVEQWGKTTDEQVAELSIIPKTSLTRRVVGKSIKYGLYALVTYVGYRVFIPSTIQSTVEGKIGHLFERIAAHTSLDRFR